MKARSLSIHRFAFVFSILFLFIGSATIGQEQSVGTKPSAEKAQYSLANGLRVVLLPDKSYPFISCFTWYGVGSKDDPQGMTGLSHLVEHLLFQNVGVFKGDQLANAVIKNGGEFSGFTSEDFTSFYFNLPANQLELAIHGEAERMRAAQFTKTDVNQEVQHLVKEARIEEEDTNHVLNREVHALAYESHPYKNPPGGWLHDLEHLSYEQACAHYDRYYHPGNACLVLTGNFDKQNAIKLIEKYFSGLSKNTNSVTVAYPQERSQLAERQIKLKTTTNKETVIIAYKAVPMSNVDAAPLAVLEQVFNGQIKNRLHTKLSEQGNPIWMDAAFELKREPGLFVIKCANIPANGSAKCMQAIDSSILQLKTKALSEAEIKQAVRQSAFNYYCQGDGPYNAAFQIGLFQTITDGHKSLNWTDQIGKVTAADVLRVAKKYLNDENRVLGQVLSANISNGKQQLGTNQLEIRHLSGINTYSRYLRLAAYQRSGHNVNKLAEVNAQNYSEAQVKLDKTDKKEKTNKDISLAIDEHGRAWHKTLSDGIDLIVVESHIQPLVEICGVIRGGAVCEDADNRGIAKLVAAILNSGDNSTGKQQQIAEQADLGLPLQAMLKFEPGVENISFRTECTNKDLPVQLQRLFHSLAQPRLLASDFESIKNDLLINIRQSEPQIEGKIQRALLSGLIASNSAYYPLHPEEEVNSITELKLEDVSDFYRKHINPLNTVLVICGDVDAKQVFSLAEQSARNWTIGNSGQNQLVTNTKHSAVLNLSDRSAYKSSLIVPQLTYSKAVLGRIIPVDNSDSALKVWAYMQVADCILSSHPLFSRLTEQFNDKPELLDEVADQPWESNVYKLADKLVWSMQINLLPRNSSAAAVSAIQNELKNLGANGVTPQEFLLAKRYVEGKLPIKESFNTPGMANFVLHGFTELNEIDPMGKLASIFSSMSYEDVNQFIMHDFKPQLAAVVVAGPKDLIKQVHAERQQAIQD